MAPTSFDPTSAPTPFGQHHWLPDEALYRPNRRKLISLGCIAIAIGYLAGVRAAERVLAWLQGGEMPKPGIFLWTLALGLGVYGIVWLIGGLVGVPTLTATADGMSLQTLFGVRKVAWTDLGPFSLRSFITPTGRRVFRASARVTPGESGRTAKITLTDSFDRPLPGLVEALNSRRQRCLAVAGFDDLAQVQPDSEIFGLVAFSGPWVTYSILVALLAVFSLEVKCAVGQDGSPIPSFATLSALGANVPTRVVYNNEWYRLFTAPLLHGSGAHIVGNAVALVWGGRALERLVGRLWYLAIYLVGGFGGDLVSLALRPSNIPGVGASGAIMAIFATLLVIGFRQPRNSSMRYSLVTLALLVMVPALYPMLMPGADRHVDYAAHLGGALTGAAMGLLLLDLWPQDERIPKGRVIAAGICVLGLALTIGAVVLVALNYQSYDRTLIPVQE